MTPGRQPAVHWLLASEPTSRFEATLPLALGQVLPVDRVRRGADRRLRHRLPATFERRAP